VPWRKQPPRQRTEENPQIRDVWLGVRQCQTLLAGLSSEVATLALSHSRSDARLEHLGGEVARLNASLVALTTALETGMVTAPSVELERQEPLWNWGPR